MNPFDLLLKIYDRANGVTKILIFIISITVICTLGGVLLWSHEKRLDKTEVKVELVEKTITGELSKMNGYLEAIAENKKGRIGRR